MLVGLRLQVRVADEAVRRVAEALEEGRVLDALAVVQPEVGVAGGAVAQGDAVGQGVVKVAVAVLAQGCGPSQALPGPADVLQAGAGGVQLLLLVGVAERGGCAFLCKPLGFMLNEGQHFMGWVEAVAGAVGGLEALALGGGGFAAGAAVRVVRG